MRNRRIRPALGGFNQSGLAAAAAAVQVRVRVSNDLFVDLLDEGHEGLFDVATFFIMPITV